jgi:hypothetical protein
MKLSECVYSLFERSLTLFPLDLIFLNTIKCPSVFSPLSGLVPLLEKLIISPVLEWLLSNKLFTTTLKVLLNLTFLVFLGHLNVRYNTIFLVIFFFFFKWCAFQCEVG